MRPFVLHAHFYQPERLNPWTGALDPEPSAAPDRDWNERVLRECYRPNAVARIFDAERRVERIVNNYERLSFNFGPTLLSWMDRAHPDVYARILDGDWRTSVRSGHGSALAQAYNHMILPLANARDRRTQILWGLADFRHRFRREAEGMWLPETAADRATIDALIDAGVAFTILAPSQAARIRPLGAGDDAWTDTPGGAGLDVGRPYRHFHSDGSGRSLAIFFYDGALAQSLAFDPATADAAVLLQRLQAAAERTDGLVHAALDGETFGHHHTFGELGLAYTLFEAAEAAGFTPTTYSAYLDEHPPTHEVEIVPGEGTAWSCAHGVGRWYRDCGCSTGGLPGWDQRWRTPLRAALDLVRDAAVEVFSDRGAELLRDPWAARDAFVDVHLGALSRTAFLERHAQRDLDDAARVDLWTLLEAQRHAMVMYTSCGWFFADVSGIETVYVLRSAARVLGLLEEAGVDVAPVRAAVLDTLAEARSNDPAVGTGADVWREQVEPAAVTPARMAAHAALLSLAAPSDDVSPTAADVPGHRVVTKDARRETRGRLTLSTARMVVVADATGRRSDFTVAALHLGGLDFHGVVAPHRDDPAVAAALERLWEAFPTAPVVRLLRLVGDVPGSGDDPAAAEFGLEQLLPDGLQTVVSTVVNDLTRRFREQYARLYHDHRRVLEMLSAAGYDLPRDLRAAAELTLSATLEEQLAAALCPDEAGAVAGPHPSAAPEGPFAQVSATLALARAQGYHLDLSPLEQALTDAVTAAARTASTTLDPGDVDTVQRWLELSGELGVDVDLSAAQEQAWEVAQRAAAGRLTADDAAQTARLGRLLGFADVAWQRRRT